MRYIDLDRVLGHAAAAELIDAAGKARRTLGEVGSPETRKELIDAQRSIWVGFRPVFEQTFGQKCWYTESENPGTDNDVDHYRPKSRVAEDPDHGGYWWEAFQWRNFRYSCHRSNRPRRNPGSGQILGKTDHFPLVDERARWRSPSEACRERPALLDPTDPEDPPHITFDQDGLAAIAPAYAGSETAVARVEASRRFLHLDWPAFVGGRRALYAVVLLHVLAGDKADEAIGRDEQGAKDQLRDSSRALIRITDAHAPYSRAAISYIRRYRDRDWVKRLVLAHIPEGL
jgi:hypothetical protein